MHLCYVADTQIPSRTANSIHVMKMCQAYRRLGHRVTLVVPAWKSVESGIDDVFTYYGLTEGFAIVRVPFSPRVPDLGYFGLLLPVLVALRRPDLIHTRSLMVGWGTARLLGLPTVLELHHVPSTSQRQRDLFRRTSGSPALAALVAITRAHAERLTSLADPRAPLTVAPDGVDSGWLADTPLREEARLAVGLETESRRLVVYTGHLYRGRGVELILEVATHLPDHLFLIVGGRQADIERYEGVAAELSNVCLVGFRPPARILAYLRAADVLLMPYADAIETTGGTDTASFASPLKLFEYLAAGRPILASRLPVLREVLRHGENAMLLPYEEPIAWVAALERLAVEPALAADLGAQARRDAEEYTWERRAERLLEFALNGVRPG